MDTSVLPPAQWQLKPFDNLTPLELYQLLKLREQVFMLEQASLYQDLDGDDLTGYHLFLKPTLQGTTKEKDSVAPLIAYGRLLPPEEKSQTSCVRLGRIVVEPSYRCQGLGRNLVKQLLASSKALFPQLNQIEIAAQTSLLDFYRSFGFKISSEPYLDGGIWHITMHLPLK